MLDRRIILPPSALLLGLAFGALAWMVLGSGALSNELGGLESALGPKPAPLPRSQQSSTSLVGAITAKPLFLMTVGPDAVLDVSARLLGVAIAPKHKAALVAIGAASPEWLQIGDNRSGLTLRTIRAQEVEFDGPLGPKSVGFDTSPSQSSSTGPAPPGQAPPGQPPPGQAPIGQTPLGQSPSNPALSPGMTSGLGPAPVPPQGPR